MLSFCLLYNFLNPALLISLLEGKFSDFISAFITNFY